MGSLPSKPTDEEVAEMLAAVEDKVGGDSDPIIVIGASTTEFHVMTGEEKHWFETSLVKYIEQYEFQNIADLQDLDRLLALELLSYRHAYWLIKDTDYDGSSFDEKAVRDAKDKLDKNILAIKTHLGIGRKNRIESESESVSDYLANLLQRSKEMGIHRDTQNAKILSLFMELKTQVGLWQRSDEEERNHNKVNMDDIFEWIVDVAIPEFDELDNHFRANQKYWIKDL